jgi:hypothetical protein
MIAGPRSSAKIKSPWAKRTVNAAKSILSCSHKAGVVGVYNRSAYENEKRAALERGYAGSNLECTALPSSSASASREP